MFRWLEPTATASGLTEKSEIPYYQKWAMILSSNRIRTSGSTGLPISNSRPAVADTDHGKMFLPRTKYEQSISYLAF